MPLQSRTATAGRRGTSRKSEGHHRVRTEVLMVVESVTFVLIADVTLT